MPVFLQCISPELRSILQDLSMTSTTKHFLSLTPDCEGSRDIMVRAGKMPSKMKITDDDDDAPKKTKKKRKPSGYNIFISECMAELGKSIPVTERMQTCGPRWSSMPDPQKEKYKNKAKEA